MKMCKYCGMMIVGAGTGTHGRYCSKKCWNEVEGFDKRLSTERKEGKISLNQAVDSGRDFSDKGKGANDIYDHMDGVVEKNDSKMDVGEVMRLASDIHPFLPSALVLLGRGMTKKQVAEKVGLDQSNMVKYLKQLKGKY